MESGGTTRRVAINQPQMGKISSHSSCLANRVPSIVDPRHLLRSCRNTPLRRAVGASTLPYAFAIFASIPNSRRKNISSRCFTRFLMSLLTILFHGAHYIIFRRQSTSILTFRAATLQTRPSHCAWYFWILRDTSSNWLRVIQPWFL